MRRADPIRPAHIEFLSAVTLAHSHSCVPQSNQDSIGRDSHWPVRSALTGRAATIGQKVLRTHEVRQALDPPKDFRDIGTTG